MEERARAQGFALTPKSEDDFGRFLKSEVERWARIIKTANITAS